MIDAVARIKSAWASAIAARDCSDCGGLNWDWRLERDPTGCQYNLVDGTICYGEGSGSGAGEGQTVRWRFMLQRNSNLVQLMAWLFIGEDLRPVGSNWRPYATD